MMEFKEEYQPKTLFLNAPTIPFKPEKKYCLCGEVLTVQKTHQRNVATLDIGIFHAREIVLHCDKCEAIYPSTELEQLVAKGGHFGYDVIEYIGIALFLKCRNEQEIQEELLEKNIQISLREIGYLGKKFIIYLALLHRESREKIRKHLFAHGGYILHLDATCEGDSPHLFSALDEVSNLVLGNVKLPSENREEIVPFLQELKKDYGNPIALVHDMGSGILKAVEEVFPKVPDFICHFHFLRDIGKDLFEYEHLIIKKAFSNYGIKNFLKQRAKTSRKEIEHDLKKLECLHHCQNHFSVNLLSQRNNLWVTAYLLILWMLDYKSELKGYGFPFDRSYLAFYKRISAAHNALLGLGKDVLYHKALRPLFSILDMIIQNTELKPVIPVLEEKVGIFDQLREALRIALPEYHEGLNDEGNPLHMNKIKENVTRFRYSKKLSLLAGQNKDYQKLIDQMDRYWNKLFADPIPVSASTGKMWIQPQRTNNILERFFREFKRKNRKKSGSLSLSKVLKAMIADTPLVKNLENPEFRSILLNGKNSLAQRFPDLDFNLVRQKMEEKKSRLDIIPFQLKKTLRSIKPKNLKFKLIPKFRKA